MRRAEVYIRNGRLRIFVYKDNSENYHYLKGNAAKEFIEKFYKTKILDMRESVNGRDISFIYNNCELKINEYREIFESESLRKLFIPIILKAKKYGEIKIVTNLKKKKVTRKNKHKGGKLVAVGLAALIIGTSSVTALSNVKKLGDYKDFIGDIFSIDNVENNDDNSFTEHFYYDDIDELQNPQDEEDTRYVSLSYEDRSSTEKAKITDSYYRSTIEKYSKMYGIDSNLIVALATQERGIHGTTMDPGGATGLMQIQNSVWDNQVLKAYNFDSNSWEEIVVSIDNLSDLDYNIKVGCMIFQESLRYMNYNTLAAIQTYNMGYGNMQIILNNYCQDTGKLKEDVLSDQYDTEWLPYRNLISAGDQNYIEHVLSYCGDDFQLRSIKPDGTVVSVNIDNNTLEKYIS